VSRLLRRVSFRLVRCFAYSSSVRERYSPAADSLEARHADPAGAGPSAWLRASTTSSIAPRTAAASPLVAQSPCSSALANESDNCVSSVDLHAASADAPWAVAREWQDSSALA